MAPALFDPDPFADDEDWNRVQRKETTTQRLDRNWSALLQELRVVQTGVQILTGFLLTLPFQEGFEDVGTGFRIVYLVTIGCAMVATLLLAAPVALHRVLFRRHRLPLLVTMAHRFAYIGLLCLGAALTGAVGLVFDITVGTVPALIAGAVTLTAFAGFWLVFPLILRARDDPRGGDDHHPGDDHPGDDHPGDDHPGDDRTPPR
ncbi:DUF6328 family protein [Gordonia sp. NB41Y]|uniref:DUF6328 family protein n=1 Tax=Gordonia sp. NB41Y TaxID=875808 RepID=UPI0002BDE3A0|nr:DUF6328 family protein [Gordonia sp. NB41Y]WLP92224.1 DUF6328 family protein [Gordonia sp. NB41Y]